MKSAFLAFGVAACAIGHALPVTNPLDSLLYTHNFWYDECELENECYSWVKWINKVGVRYGFIDNHVYNRRLEGGANSHVVRNATISTDAGMFIANIRPWLDVYATVGVTTLSLGLTTPEGAPLTETNVALKYSPRMSYSVGANVAVWKYQNLCLGIEGEFLFSNTELSSYTNLTDGSITSFNNTGQRKANYYEWQLALPASYIIYAVENLMVAPFIALQFSGVNWNTSSTGGSVLLLDNLTQQQVTGWTLGMTAIIFEILGISFEGRFGNEKAITTVAEISF